MAEKHETKRHHEKLKKHETGFWQSLWHDLTHWAVKHRFWQRLAIGLIAFIFLIVAGMFGLAQWYINKHKSEPLTIGATFIPNYARYYDLNPKETFSAIVNDLGIKRLRLVSYWSEIEKNEGTYDWEELDWQMRAAEAAGVKVSLAIGLRQPRWPECHMPTWAERMSKHDWQPKLMSFIEDVVQRYKSSPALDSWQLENEYFLTVFGICPDHSRDRLIEEFNLVKRLDPNHTLVVSMSNNAIGTPIGAPTPDSWAISVYKRVWDKTITQRYFEYPIPAWYYAFRAGWTELTRGRPVFVHELQAEAWTPEEFGGTKETPLIEQDKSMNPERLRDRIEYGRSTGMRTIDLWGAEWWYWRKVKHNDPGLWDTAREEIKKVDAANQQLTD
jgi:hypothetical protein